MLRAFVTGLALALAPLAALAQAARAQDPTDSKAPAPAVAYESVFTNYRPYIDPEIARWREVNEEVGRLKGHIGHVPQQRGEAAKPAAKPPAPGGHGAHK